MAETKTTRAEARAAGRTTFFTGKPCVRENVAPRLVSNGACTCPLCKETWKAAVATPDAPDDSCIITQRDRIKQEYIKGGHSPEYALEIADGIVFQGLPF